MSSVCALAQSPAAHQANRVSAQVDQSQPMRLAGHLPDWKARAADLGTIADTETVQLNFALTRSPEVQAAFDLLLADQQNPSSARYHQWLTPQQVGEQYGPTQHDIDALTTWLTGKGFKIDGIPLSHVVVQTSASAAVVSSALGLQIHKYSLPDHPAGERLRAPSNDPVLPSALMPLVSYVAGLIDVPVYTHSHRMENVPVAALGNTSEKNQTNAVTPSFTLSGGTHFLAPADFNLIYGVNSAGLTGAGQKIMIIGGSRLLPADLTGFENLAALTAYQPNYIIGPTFTDPGYTADDNTGEGTLDFERAYGTAPGATIDMVIAKNWLSGTVTNNLELYAINSVNDPVMSMSYGSCEFAYGSANVMYESNSIFSVAAAQGISVFASSGDSGVTGCADHGVAAVSTTQQVSISDICASPYVTCVGGTQFSDTASPSTYWSNTNGAGELSALSYIPEGVWNEPTATSQSGVTSYVLDSGGGGPSVYITKPIWQTGLGVPSDGARDTPDISFSASGHNAYFSCLAYAKSDCINTVTGFGGTSASAPSMAGIAALIVQKLGARQGNINPLLYKTFTSTPAAFHDPTPATSGVASCSTATPSTCNNSTPSPTALTGGIAGYPLTTGYDLATGLGSLNVSAFLTAISTPTLIPTSVALTANPATISTAGTVQFTATVTQNTGTVLPTGNVVFSSNGSALATVPLAAGTATTANLSFPTAGTYTITAAYVGDTANAASTTSISYTVTVPVLPATTSSLTGTTGVVTTQNTLTYSVSVASTATGTPSGTVTLQFVRTGKTYTATGLLAGGKATIPVTGNLPSAGAYSVTAFYPGDGNFSASTSNSLTVTINSVAANIALNFTPSNPLTTVTPIQPTATVTSATGTGVPAGMVTFFVDTIAQGAAVPVGANGVATSPVIYLTAGAHSLSATYSGDTTFATATSGNVTATAIITPTTLTVTPASQTAFNYQTETLSITVTGLSTNVITQAIITATENGISLGSAITAQIGTTGTATITIGPLSAGTHSVLVTFPGGSTYATATATATITVGTATVAVAPLQTALTTPAGTTITDSVSILSTNFSGTQTISCAAVGNGFTANNAPACVANPSAISFTGSGSVATTITLTSIKSSAVSTGTITASTSFTGLEKSLGGAALCSLLAFCLPRKGRRTLRTLRVLTVAIFLGLTLATVTGCQGPNNFSVPVVGTTKGAYTVTVRATDSTNIVTGSNTVQLTIQ